MSGSDSVIDEVTTQSGPHYEPFGWHHWPDHPWMSYQFRRALGETQVGGGTVSECMQVAARMQPGDRESWHQEWLRVADKNSLYAQTAEQAGHLMTARAAWLRATDYYRSAEFWLDADDPRRIETFTRCEDAFANAGKYFVPPIERVEVPYEHGASLTSYFLNSPSAAGGGPRPVLIAFGGLDSFKEELYFMVARDALARGISCLLVDGPGQGATLRRQDVHTRPDYEVPVAYCLDYLAERPDVDMEKVAVCGSSLGGYYAARAGSHEHRLAAVVSHGAIWDIHEMWKGQGEDFGIAGHIKWVFGVDSMAKAIENAQAYRLEGHLEHMTCPYLIVHGGHDVLGVRQAQTVADYATSHGVDVTFRLVSEDETGAEHCQHDNPTLGMEIIADWLAQIFGIDERGSS